MYQAEILSVCGREIILFECNVRSTVLLFKSSGE